MSDRLTNITKHITLVLVLFVFSNSQSYAQTYKDNWLPVKVDNGEKIYVNTNGLTLSKEGDIYVWVLEENDPPVTLEAVNNKIYKTKTYFLLNKKLKRYSILQIILYDNKDNVIKGYTYQRNMDNKDYRYSSPIMEGSNVEAVLLKCLKHLEPANKN